MPVNFGFSTENLEEETREVQEEKTDISNGNKDTKDITETTEVEKTHNGETTETENIEFAIEPGTTIEFDGKSYSVDDNGNIIDSEGNIFKEAKDVKEWKDSLEVSEKENNNIIDITSVQDAIGIDITDEDGNVIEFENSSEGIKNYLNQVLENTKEQNYKEALDMLYSKYPIIRDVLNYYIANGNSLEGFNQILDRSSIELSEDNVEQQENIIKMAWKEQGRKGDINSYIDYLKSTNTLFTVAEEELNGLKEADKEYAETMAKQAKEAELQQAKEIQAYWSKVDNMIKGKKLGGYQLPDTIIRNIDGQKKGGSLEDFFNYIYRIDKDGKSRYVHDLEAESDDSRLNDELLRAYIKYTGGNYESLVNMKINEKEVNRLKLQSKQSINKQVKFTPPVNRKSNKVDFGV